MAFVLQRRDEIRQLAEAECDDEAARSAKEGAKALLELIEAAGSNKPTCLVNEFHSRGHDALCRVQHGIWWHHGACGGTGEDSEQLFSFLSKTSGLVRCMNLSSESVYVSTERLQHMILSIMRTF